MMPNDLIDRALRRQLQSSIRALPNGTVDDPISAVQHAIAVRRRRRRRGSAVLTLALVVAIAAAALVTDGITSRTARVSTQPGTTGRTAVSVHRGVTAAPAPPLARRRSPATAWTGEELVIWGGVSASGPGREQALVDGAAYAPRAERWRMLAPAPLDPSTQPVAVDTDAGVLVVSDRSAALWDPATNRWRRLDDAPRPVRDIVSSGTLGISYSANASVDVRTGRWRDLPSPPMALERVTVAWSGSELIAVGGVTQPNDPRLFAAGVAYDPEQDRWRDLRVPNGVNAQALAAARDGDRVVVVNYEMAAVQYSLEHRRWTSLPRVPALFSEWTPLISASDGMVLTVMSGTFVVLDERDLWTPLPYLTAPPIALVHAGKAIYSVGLDMSGRANTIDAIDVRRATSAARRIQVGIGNFARNAMQRVLDVSSTDTGGVESVQVRLSDSCRIESTNSSEQPSAANTVIDNDGRPTSWLVTPDGRSWSTSPSPFRSFAVACESAARARAIAKSTSFRRPYG